MNVGDTIRGGNWTLETQELERDASITSPLLSPPNAKGDNTAGADISLDSPPWNDHLQDANPDVSLARQQHQELLQSSKGNGMRSHAYDSAISVVESCPYEDGKDMVAIGKEIGKESLAVMEMAMVTRAVNVF